MLLGAALCGIGASLLWASEAAIAVGYPEDENRGRYVGIWMGIRQMGPLVGGAISLALNVKTKEKGKVTYTTYLGLVAISSLGAPFALLLSQPQKVNRSDGTKIPYMKKTNFKTEARAIFRQLKNPYMLLLIPVFLAGQFGVTYQGNYLTSKSNTPGVKITTRKVNIAHSLLHRPLPRFSILPCCRRRRPRQHVHGHHPRCPPILTSRKIQICLHLRLAHRDRILDMERRRPDQTNPHGLTTILRPRRRRILQLRIHSVHVLPLLLRGAADVCLLVDGRDQGREGRRRCCAHDGNFEKLGEYWEHDCVCDWRCAYLESDADDCGFCVVGAYGAVYANGGVWGLE